MRKKLYLLFIAFTAVQFAFCQANKPDEGDVGLRYGVTFNGNISQTIAVSGILKNRWEIGSGISVLYQAQKSQNISTYTNVNPNSVTIQTEVVTSTSRYIAVTLLPFAVYHFPVKSNLDVYAGINAIAGTGPLYLYYNNSFTTQGGASAAQASETFKFPVGYQVGGGITVGCQYFFYKRLALGVEATLGASDIVQKGPLTITEVASSGNNAPITVVNNQNMDTHTFSVQSASSAGVSLTFYFVRKVNRELGKVAKELN